MLLIYTPQSTTRLQYICKFIFEEMLGISYSLTLDEVNFSKHDGYKINYSHKDFDNSFQIKPHGLLFQNGIKPQEIIYRKEDDTTIFFKTGSEHFSFDIFSAIFYLISRYEEYLPHEKDMYGRYAHINSVAHKEGFLNLPLVNIWLAKFKVKLKNHFATLNFQLSIRLRTDKLFNFQPTYDIDMAWSYKEKGLWRNIGGFFKKPSWERLVTLFTKKQDPFDCYRFLDDTHTLYNLNPIYFFLVAKENGQYDKNILPTNNAMQSLIQQHATKYSIGIHPSWKSNDDVNIVKEEIKTLEKITQKKITSSRQHYIKFDLPNGYNKLIELGIKDDYSMGYGTINGFRASVASSYNWYDLENEKITTLRIHPFCFMDANSHYEQKQTVEESYKELMHYYLLCKKYDTTLITIFHNSFLGSSKEFEGWAAMYKKFITQLQ
jgi:hypothetical protein